MEKLRAAGEPESTGRFYSLFTLETPPGSQNGRPAYDVGPGRFTIAVQSPGCRLVLRKLGDGHAKDHTQSSCAGRKYPDAGADDRNEGARRHRLAAAGSRPRRLVAGVDFEHGGQ